MVIWLDWITIIISLFLMIKFLPKIIQNERFILYILFSLFYVIPLFLDCLYMPPLYSDWLGIGFSESSNDYLTRIVYDIIILFTQFIILYYKKESLKNTSFECQYDKIINKNTLIALILGMIIPTFFVLFLSSYKFIIYTPQWREYFDASVIERYTYFEKLSYIGVACSIIMIYLKKIKYPLIVKPVCFLFLYMNICIEGKRSIIFFALLLFLLIKIPGLRDKTVIMKKRRKKIINLIFISSLAVGLMITITMFVKIENRGYDAKNITELYTATRIDFFRDDRVRLAIYSLINPNKLKILDYPLQTVTTAVFSFFPLDYILNSKHIVFPSYSMFVTSALLGYYHKAVMTPSFYAEIISNFNIIGIIAMPFICIWFANISRKRFYPHNIFIITCFVLIQMYDFAYISYFIEFTLLICIMNKINLKDGDILLKSKVKDE